MSRRNNRRKPMSEINVVPYIDVTLVLLIIFMVTAPLQQSGVEVDLPVASTTNTVEQKETPPIIITINKDARYFLSTKGIKDEPIIVEDLVPRITEIQTKTPQVEVYIRGDTSVDYGKVVQVMAELKKAGVPRVGLVTSPLEQ